MKNLCAVHYVRGRVARIYEKNGKLIVKGVDTLLGASPVEIEADMVVLATAGVANKGAEELAQKMHISYDPYQFFAESHPKLKPVETNTAGIYLAMYAKKGFLTKFLRICIETLSSLPSIVVGLFGYLVFLVFFGLGKSLLAGALSVSILAIPVITTTTEDAINGLPGHYLQASLGLGATRWQSIYHVLIPACIPRIMTGVILAAGRGFGEAAALLYTTGSGTDLRWNNWNLTSPTCPLNIFRPAETLSLQIWGLQINGQDPNLANLSAAILMILVLLFSIGANALSRHINKKNSGN